MDRLKDLVMWLGEIFPNVFPTLFRVKYVKRSDQIKWYFKNPNSDVDDVFTLIIYDVKRSFFDCVVKARIEELHEGYGVTYCYAGNERIIITFNATKHCNLGDTLGGVFTTADYWPQRDMHKYVDAPPQR